MGQLPVFSQLGTNKDDWFVCVTDKAGNAAAGRRNSEINQSDSDRINGTFYMIVLLVLVFCCTDFSGKQTVSVTV